MIASVVRRRGYFAGAAAVFIIFLRRRERYSKSVRDRMHGLGVQRYCLEASEPHDSANSQGRRSFAVDACAMTSGGGRHAVRTGARATCLRLAAGFQVSEPLLAALQLTARHFGGLGRPEFM